MEKRKSIECDGNNGVDVGDKRKLKCISGTGSNDGNL